MNEMGVGQQGSVERCNRGAAGCATGGVWLRVKPVRLGWK